jgi:hypothetical protein
VYGFTVLNHLPSGNPPSRESAKTARAFACRAAATHVKATTHRRIQTASAAPFPARELRMVITAWPDGPGREDMSPEQRTRTMLSSQPVEKAMDETTRHRSGCGHFFPLPYLIGRCRLLLLRLRQVRGSRQQRFLQRCVTRHRILKFKLRQYL